MLFSEFGNSDEKEKFLSINSTPVKLDPGFDSLSRAEDLMATEGQKVDQPPRDR